MPQSIEEISQTKEEVTTSIIFIILRNKTTPSAGPRKTTSPITHYPIARLRHGDILKQTKIQRIVKKKIVFRNFVRTSQRTAGLIWILKLGRGVIRCLFL